MRETARATRATICSAARAVRLALTLMLVLILFTGASATITVQARQDESNGTDQPFRRVLLEAEHFETAGEWQTIGVGQGNYMVDAIGASHVSGGRLLHADAGAIGSTARTDLSPPGAGRYKLWARYEYPDPTRAVPMEVTVEQGGETIFRTVYGRRDATRMWFFRRPDAPWQDFENGVEGLVAEGYVIDLANGPAVITVRAASDDGPLADRNLDLLFLTDDLKDTFRGRGDRLYPMLDELARAATGRTWVRLTNPAESGAHVRFSAQYTINRSPWRSRTTRIDRNGLTDREAVPLPLSPGERTPWLDLSCPDTTHDCHLHLRADRSDRIRRIDVTVEVASAPNDAAILRRLDYAEPFGERLLLNLPPYPVFEPERILTGEEVLDALLTQVEQSPPPAGGRPPERFPVYATMGDGWDANFGSRARIYDLYRRVFASLGPNAPTVHKVTQAVPAHDFLRALGRPAPVSFLYGGYRWFPSDEEIDEAVRELETSGAHPLLRGFNFGDEVKLDEWLPKEGRDQAFADWLRERGAAPRTYLPADVDVNTDAEALWPRIRLADAVGTARTNPRLYVDSKRFLEGWAVERLAAQTSRLRSIFGEDIIFGANFSPHPFFWPTTAQWATLFRAGAANRASHDDYWWQVSEIGPEATGYLLDVFRAGLGHRPGVLQPYVMPHSPGNTDRGFRLGLATALIHGARALDLFNLGPEQGATENYISARDPERYRTVRDALYQLGAVEDTLLDGTRRPSRVGLVLSESSEPWELEDPGRAPRPLVGIKEHVPSVVYAQERKLLWQALRHAQVPTETVLEVDLARGPELPYDVLYLPASHLTPEAAAGLAAWVANGGTLVSVAGGGLRDPYDAPLDTLLPVYGIRGADLERRETFFRPRLEVPRLEPLDHVRVELPGTSFDLPTLAVRQRLDPLDEARVLGRFDDGSAAIVEHAYGRGRAVLIGTLAGTAYFQSGFPKVPPLPDRGPGQHSALVDFRADLRALIASWADGVPRSWPVATDPLVEVGQVETPAELLLILANGRGAPTRATVRLHGVGPVDAATSLTRGALSFVQDGEDVTIEVELGDVDYVRLAQRPSPSVVDRARGAAAGRDDVAGDGAGAR